MFAFNQALADNIEIYALYALQKENGTQDA